MAAPEDSYSPVRVVAQRRPGAFCLLATLQSYDAAFLALPPSVDQSVLTSYVNGGGNVYINAGTGIGGAAAEAANWNTFLNAFGLNLASSYNGIGGVTPIVSGSPIMSGVSALYQNNGNTISLTGSSATTIPEPTSVALMATGLLWFAARRRARP